MAGPILPGRIGWLSGMYGRSRHKRIAHVRLRGNTLLLSCEALARRFGLARGSGVVPVA